MSILVYDRDPVVVDYLKKETAPLGLPFLHARTPSSIKEHAARNQISLAFLDLDDRDSDIHHFATLLYAQQPNAQIFLMGRERSAPELLRLLRRAGTDYLTKPLDSDEFREAVATRLRRGERISAELAQLEARVAELQAAAAGKPMLSPELEDELSQFLEFSLQTFMQIERQNVELRQRVAVMDDPAAAAKMNRIFHGWIIHPDQRFSQGVKALEGRIGVQFNAQMSTGGEVLDRIGAEKPDLIVLGDSLPDIPAELVTEGIRSQHPSVAMVVVRHWGAPDMRAELLGNKEGDSIIRQLHNAEDLVAVLESAKSRCAASDLGREFFRKFAETNAKFLEHYKRFRLLLDGRS